MSRIDVDDLVAGFKGQAISQEAIDLALLQKQLAQTLRPYGAPSASGAYPSPIQTSSLHQYTSPQSSYSASGMSSQYSAMNTPTSARWNGPGNPGPYFAESHAGTSSPVGMSTRSRSVSRTRAVTPRERSNSLASAGGAFDNGDWDEMQEVEEELEPSASSSEYYYEPQQQQYYGQHAQSMRAYPNSPPTAYPQHQFQNQSSFASSDPFYLATAAAAARPPAPVQSNSGSGKSYFAPAVGFAAYAPAGNRWAPVPPAGAVQ